VLLPSCMKVRVESALRRELDARTMAQENHRHRIPLGLAMLEQGWIDGVQLRRPRGAAGGRAAGWANGWCATRSERAAGDPGAGPAVELPGAGVEFHDAEGLTALVPRLFVDAFGALPLRVAAAGFFTWDSKTVSIRCWRWG